MVSCIFPVKNRIYDVKSVVISLTNCPSGDEGTATGGPESYFWTERTVVGRSPSATIINSDRVEECDQNNNSKQAPGLAKMGDTRLRFSICTSITIYDRISYLYTHIFILLIIIYNIIYLNYRIPTNMDLCINSFFSVSMKDRSQCLWYGLWPYCKIFSFCIKLSISLTSLNKNPSLTCRADLPKSNFILFYYYRDFVVDKCGFYSH